MDITLAIEKSLEQNAAVYYEKAKILRQKIDGLKAALGKTAETLSTTETKMPRKTIPHYQPPPAKKWFEKFRWFYTTSSKLAIGGRDATTNDILIKKHLEAHDLVFHTDIAGSPFFILKGGEHTSQDDLEVAQATALFSRAWRGGISEVKVYYVEAGQVSQTAPSGEYLTKGGFMIYGKKNYLAANLEGGITIRDGMLMCGPWEALKAYPLAIRFVPGDTKPSDAAKILKKRLSYDDLDAIIRALPAGGIKIL